MKKNTAILNTVTKMINFNFNGEIFEVDLKEGDLEDSWNCIETKDKITFDVNFSWQEDTEPAFSVYPLVDNGDGTSIKIVEVIGDKNQYFYDKPFEFNQHVLKFLIQMVF